MTTLVLDDLMNEALEAQRKARQEAEKARQTEIEQRHAAILEANIADLRAACEVVREGLYESLNPTASVRTKTSQEIFRAVIEREFSGIPVFVELSRSANAKANGWAVTCSTQVNNDYNHISLLHKLGLSGEAAVVYALLALGELRDKYAPEDAAKRARDKAEAEQRRRAEVARQEQRAEAERAALAEHERLMPQVDAIVADARAKAWQWSPGKTITLYRISWCSGAWNNDEDAGADYDGGWTAHDFLGDFGYITVYRNSDRRVLKLNKQIHKPVWERVEIDGMDALFAADGSLGHVIRSLRLPGIARRPDDRSMFCVAEDGDYEASVELDPPILNPHDWIKSLVEAA